MMGPKKPMTPRIVVRRLKTPTTPSAPPAVLQACKTLQRLGRGLIDREILFGFYIETVSRFSEAGASTMRVDPTTEDAAQTCSHEFPTTEIQAAAPKDLVMAAEFYALSRQSDLGYAWLSRAAKHGELLLWVAACYEEGRGVARDPVKAAHYYALANDERGIPPHTPYGTCAETTTTSVPKKPCHCISSSNSYPI
eukprot:PhF_6_TR3692/c0_g2_i1/m.5256